MKIIPNKDLMIKINNAMPTMWDLPDWSRFSDYEVASLYCVELTDEEVLHKVYGRSNFPTIEFGYDIRRSAMMELAARKFKDIENA